MPKVLRLLDVGEVGVSPEFIRQIHLINMEVDWQIFNINIGNTTFNTAMNQSIGKWFCHFFGISIIDSSTLWLPKITQRNGDVARYQDISDVLDELGLKLPWEKFMQRCNYTCLDDTSGLLNSMAVHWYDVHRFFSNSSILCKSILTSKESFSSFFAIKISSFQEQGAQKSNEIEKYAQLVESGSITFNKALKRVNTTKKPKILFICRANIQRSLTAEHLFKSMFSNIEFNSAGVSQKECVRNNSTLCTDEMLIWADCIFVFDQLHVDRIRDNAKGVNIRKIINLEIEDVYKYDDPRLISLLKTKIGGSLGRLNCGLHFI